MGEPNSGRRTRALGTRGSVVSYLAANGDITDPKGMASTALAEAVGYPGSSAAFAQLLSGMERSGLIEREIRGKRTYRIAATAPALRGRPSGSRRPGPVGPAAAASRRGQPAPDGDAAGHDLGRDLAAAAGGGTGFDYDELARRLLVQLVRRLTVSPESPLPGEAPGPANTVPLNTVPANPGQVNAGQANPVYGGPADADPGSASPEPASPVPADPAPADLRTSRPQTLGCTMPRCGRPWPAWSRGWPASSPGSAS